MRYTFFSRLVWLFVFIILTSGLLNSCAGKNVVRDLKYEKVFGGPPYSAREKKAEELRSYSVADSYGAVKIGSFNITTGDRNIFEVAAEEAAKLGADYYWIDLEPVDQYYKQRYVLDGVSSTNIGNQRITTERYHFEDITDEEVYVYNCLIYRIPPTEKRRDFDYSRAIFGCLYEGLYCSAVRLEAYLDANSANKLDTNSVVRFFEYLAARPKMIYAYEDYEYRHELKKYQSTLEKHYEKLKILLNRALINPDGYYAALEIVRGKKYSLEDFRKPDKPKQPSTSEYFDYVDKRRYPDVLKLHSDFLKKVEKALVGYKPPK